MILLFALVETFIYSSIGLIIPYQDENRCGLNQYFQFSSLRCVNCPPNMNQSSDPLRCTCNRGFRYIANYGGPASACVACDDMEVQAADGWSCVRCGTDSDYDPVTKSCRLSCSVREALLDYQENGLANPSNRKRCLACQGNTQPKALQTCERCSQDVIDVTSSLVGMPILCQCPAGGLPVTRTTKTGVEVTIESTGGMCFSTEKLKLLSNSPALYAVSYAQRTVESAFLRTYLRSAQALCSFYQNFTACQMLANMCVMIMYTEENYRNTRLSSTDACKEYLLLVANFRGDFVNRLIDWPVSMPWLYYKADSASEIIGREDFRTKFGRQDVMNFVAVKFSARGAYLGIQNNSRIFELCTEVSSKADAAYRFGTSYKRGCFLRVSDLWQMQEVFFYDLFMMTDGGDLYAVPVLNENIRYAGELVNQQSDSSRWRLTRRFFLVDNLSGRTSLESPAVIVQYAEKMELLIRLRKDGYIYPPLLKVRYNSIEVGAERATESSPVHVEFRVSYAMDQSDVHRNIEIAVGVFSVLAVVFAFVRLLSWRRREGVLQLDGSTFFKLLAFLFSALSFSFLIVIIGVCLQWLFFCKHQSVVYRLLPSGSELKLVQGLFIAAFAMKLLDVVHLLLSQVFLDIFFIDWERPRGRIVLPADVGPAQGVSAPVSIIRTLFVANEWREIQTLRRIKPTLLLILVLFALKVIGFEYLTTTDPISRFSVDNTVDYVGEPDFCLRLAVNSIVFLSVAVILWAFFGIVFERFVADGIGDFIDFCSLSNVSIFVMSHRQFGYYIHGRSVHGRADTDLHELYEQFKREEDSMCGKRGLEPNSDLQTFEMALAPRFRLEYDKLFEPLTSRALQGARKAQAPLARQNPSLGSALPPAVERSVAAYANLNRFLSSFIEHSIRDIDYVTKRKLLLERLLDAELEPADFKSVFYHDDGRSFTDVLLYGQEWSFVLFYLLLFTMVDWLAGWNYVLAAICTYFADIIVVTARDKLGTMNLARKTMVDSRFLL